jgi:hypothetical protein
VLKLKSFSPRFRDERPAPPLAVPPPPRETIALDERAHPQRLVLTDADVWAQDGGSGTRAWPGAMTFTPGGGSNDRMSHAARQGRHQRSAAGCVC